LHRLGLAMLVPLPGCRLQQVKTLFPVSSS
jgi:hypothetical protein